MPKPVFFRTPEAFRAWLEKHHASALELWVGYYKKDSGKGGLTYKPALDEALCYGWIDGQTAPVDETWYRQRFTPRRQRSKWSQINRASVERLHGEGRLAPAGLRQMEAAKADGRWDAAYASPANMQVPPDLAAALEPQGQKPTEHCPRCSHTPPGEHIGWPVHAKINSADSDK
jgi:uncharacterized protein YdeI (YjbR/CyaY-like superfamily)